MTERGITFTTREAKEIQAEEQDAFDAMPEGLKGGDRGQAMDQALQFLQAAYDELDTAVTCACDAVDNLETATA